MEACAPACGSHALLPRLHQRASKCCGRAGVSRHGCGVRARARRLSSLLLPPAVLPACNRITAVAHIPRTHTTFALPACCAHRELRHSTRVRLPPLAARAFTMATITRLPPLLHAANMRWRSVILRDLWKDVTLAYAATIVAPAAPLAPLHTRLTIIMYT